MPTQMIDEHPADDEEHQPEQQRHQPQQLLGGVRREPEAPGAGRLGARRPGESVMHPSSPKRRLRTVVPAPPRLGTWHP